MERARDERRRAGFVGVGAMGSAMAGRALADGLEVVVFDVNEKATAALSEQGAQVAASPRELAERCDAAAVIVLDDDQVREVVCGPDGLLAADEGADPIVIHSTIHLTTLFEVERAARERGRAVVDAGVSGHTVGAARGQLAVMVGGDEDAIGRCQFLMETYGGLVERMGELGAGMRAKIARNLASFGQCTALYEAMRLIEESGGSLEAFARIVRHSEEQSRLLDQFLSGKTVRPGSDESEVSRGRLALSNVVVPTARKDLSAALELAHELGIALPVGAASHAEVAATWGAEPGPKT